MKRLSTGVLAAFFVTLCGLSAVAAPASATQGNIGNSVAQGGAPPADFGSPPSGQIPILYNDHHVYSKPDLLKQGRVLAALVKGGTLFIPLRSMFEQMGATVSWDAGSQTATVSKPGAEVKGDRRQTRSHDQRRVSSAGRSADDVSRRRGRAGPRHFGRAWARTFSGFPTSVWSSFGIFRRRRRRVRHLRRLRHHRRRHLRRHRRRSPYRAKRSLPATTSSRRRSTTSSVRVTAAATLLRSAAEASSTSVAFR